MDLRSSALWLVLAIGCGTPQRQTPSCEDYRVDVTRCPVHGDWLQEEVVEVRHMHCQYVPGYHQFRAGIFPFANLEVVDPYAQADCGRVLCCQQCRDAYRRLARWDADPAFQEEWFQSALEGRFDEFIAKHRRMSMADDSALPVPGR